MKTLLGTVLVFLTACSGPTLEPEQVLKDTNQGVKIMSQKIYTSEPTMQIDVTKSYIAIINTNLGEITIDLFGETAPNTVNNFIFLSKDKFYDDVIFHRVISGFMIQGGDASGTGHGDKGRYPGYKFADELNNPQKYDRGIVAMANSGPNTNGSQFFIMHKDYPLPYEYTIFGIVTKGLEVVDAIAATATTDDRPLDDIVIIDVQIDEK